MKKKVEKVYLCGPMEFAANNGLDWRLEARDELAQIGISCIIPNEEEADLKPENGWDWLKINREGEYINLMRKIIERDLGFVEEADVLVGRWEGERMSGTIHEVGYAYQLGKPIYLISTQPITVIPGWFLACCTKRFQTVQEVRKRLETKYVEVKRNSND